MNIYSILTSKPHNPHYLMRYHKFILACNAKNVNEKRIKRTKKFPEGQYMESHHILPKAKDMFPEFKCEKTFSWNLIDLTYREHFIAHWLLWKAYDTASVKYAFNLMFKSETTCKLTSRVYEKLKQDMSKLMSQPKSEEHKRRMRKPKPVGFVKKISDILTGRKKTQEHVNKVQQSRKNNGWKPSKEHRLSASKKLSGSGNPRALKWKITFKNGNHIILDCLKTWCLENNFKYHTIYMRWRNNDKSMRDGFVIEKL